jgi:hypothetical protein
MALPMYTSCLHWCWCACSGHLLLGHPLSECTSYWGHPLSESTAPPAPKHASVALLDPKQSPKGPAEARGGPGGGSGVVPGVGPGWSRGWVRGWARHTGAQSLARSSPIAKDSGHGFRLSSALPSDHPCGFRSRPPLTRNPRTDRDTVHSTRKRERSSIPLPRSARDSPRAK